MRPVCTNSKPDKGSAHECQERSDSYQASSKGPTQNSFKKTGVQATKWEVIDEQLDEALRQTFPASDALSIIQTARGSGSHKFRRRKFSPAARALSPCWKFRRPC